MEILENLVEGEIVVRVGVRGFSYSKYASPGSVKVAIDYFLQKPQFIRNRWARRIANYDGDFYKESVSKKEFPILPGFGYSTYVDLRELFLQKYKKEIRLPKGIKNKLHGMRKIDWTLPNGVSRKNGSNRPMLQPR